MKRIDPEQVAKELTSVQPMDPNLLKNLSNAIPKGKALVITSKEYPKGKPCKNPHQCG